MYDRTFHGHFLVVPLTGSSQVTLCSWNHAVGGTVELVRCQLARIAGVQDLQFAHTVVGRVAFARIANRQAVDDVINRLHDGTNLEEIDELEGELLKIRQRASTELVNEQLDADESYIIYQNMLNGCQAMLVRMREKIQASLKENA